MLDSFITNILLRKEFLLKQCDPFVGGQGNMLPGKMSTGTKH